MQIKKRSVAVTDFVEKTHRQYRLKNRVTQFILQMYKMVDVG